MGSEGIQEMVVKGYKPTTRRGRNSGDLMHSRVITVNYWAINFKVAKRLDLNCVHHTKEIIII